MAAEQISNLDEPLFAAAPVRYVFRSVLGSGAFATVYLAQDLATGNRVVVKRLREPRGEDVEASIERFRAEVAATRQLEHKNIVRILDDGVGDGNRPFLVTEYTPGRSLAAVLKESGPLTTRNAVEVAVGLASALAYVHAKGFVHRDLKPSNILIPDGPDYRNAKLLDFGVAGRLEKGGRTQAGMIIGTLRYMSPEQIKGEEQSAATDVYGFGLLLYEMLAGSAPVKREQDLTTLLIAIRDGLSAEDLKRVEPDLADLIARCVQTNPAERPAMTVVLSELERLGKRSDGETEEVDAFELLGAGPPPAGAISPPVPPAERPAPSGAQLLTQSTLVFGTPGAGSVPASPAERPAQSAAQRLTESTLVFGAPGAKPALTPAPTAEPTLAQLLTESTLAFSKQQQGPASAPVMSTRPAAFQWVAWIAITLALAAISAGSVFYFMHAHRPTGGHPQSITQGEKAGAPEKAASGESNAPSGESQGAVARTVGFSAGILLMAASVMIWFWLRKWLGSRSEVKSQAYELMFGSRERTDLSATIAFQLQDLVANVRKLDQRILAGTVALMLEEYGRATDTKDRQAALMNVVALSEKLAGRMSPWYERYKEVIASAVAVMGGVSGLMTAINSVLSHKR